MLHRLAGGILSQKIVAFPIRGWPDRSGSESAAAIRANIQEHVLHTLRAKRTLVTADARLQRVRRQRDVAILASGPELQHGSGTNQVVRRASRQLCCFDLV